MSRLTTFFVFLAMASTSLTSAQTPVHVSIYYESLCPDSIKFITTQFYPTWEMMMKYMTVEFIPYGNSNTTKDGDGHYTFECQHGPAECLGNKVQACALGHLTKDEDKVKFINCMMMSKNVSNNGLECATTINVKHQPIEACLTSDEGNMALENLGVKTKALTPPIKSVPTIVFNNEYTQAEQQKIASDFKSALCSHITGTKPAECNAKGGSAAVLPSFVIAVLAVTGALLH